MLCLATEAERKERVPQTMMLHAAFLWFLAFCSFAEGYPKHAKLEVTLARYSGIPNPTWEVPAGREWNNIRKLLRCYSDTGLPSLLAYQGFIVRQTHANGTVDLINVRRLSDIGLESALLQSGQHVLNAFDNTYKNYYQGVYGEIESILTAAGRRKREADSFPRVRLARDGTECECPDYDPGHWNDDSDDKSNNNCYNYATNSKTGTFAQPGRGDGEMYEDLTAESVKAAAIRDGLTDLGDNPEGDGCCVVALFIDEGTDFHWYRKDSDGNWSHKPGSTAATNLDNSGDEISDPRDADTGDYTFVCFMYYCPGDITINK